MCDKKALNLGRQISAPEKRGKDVRATKDEISELNSYMVQCRERGGERDV
jgi:hypothetical protein